ncbi:MAG: hypothetical protein OXE53_18345 [Deltaproteobacteria bacterium]|nr:hypothetical protein [Deltaproteobacteria bacterium]
MPHRCRDCRKRFSVRVGTPLQDTKLGYRAWAMAIYLMAAGGRAAVLRVVFGFGRLLAGRSRGGCDASK